MESIHWHYPKKLDKQKKKKDKTLKTKQKQTNNKFGIGTINVTTSFYFKKT